MSRRSHRALWFLHLSKHWKARDEIGLIHWATASGSVDHRGDPGFRSLGFTPERRSDPGQMTLDFGFYERAKLRSWDALNQQLCDKILGLIELDGEPPTVAEIFERHCNDSPVTSLMLKESILSLRRERELVIHKPDGRIVEVANKISFADRISRPDQRILPGLIVKRWPSRAKQ